MRLDRTSSAAPAISPATWCAFTLLVLFLGALSLAVIGCSYTPPMAASKDQNYYACECDCPLFAIGAKIQTLQNVPIRDNHRGDAGVFLDAPTGSTGTIIDGPVLDDFNGTQETWWRITWDDPNLQPFPGWVAEADPILGAQMTATTSSQVAAKDQKTCFPAAFNVNLDGGTAPTPADLDADCAATGRAGAAIVDVLNTKGPLPPGVQCTCHVSANDSTQWASECDNIDASQGACSVAASVCTVSGSDPAPPIPDPVEAGLLEPTTVCRVSGQVGSMTVGGHQPKHLPSIDGLVQLRGRPCPNNAPPGSCLVGLAYQLRADPIEFDSGSIFADDPRFVDLTIVGATAPNGVNLGPNLVGGLISQPFTAVSSARARRSGSSKSMTLVTSNDDNKQNMALAVNWATKACILFSTAPLTTTVQDDDGTTLSVSVEFNVQGTMINQPPLANAGADQTVECTSPAGAQVTLNGLASTDADNNIAYYIWRHDSEVGALVGNASASPAQKTPQGFGQKKYFLRVVDTNLTADTASVNVNVVDTTPPVISCNAPATITPPDGPVAFTATATDTCGAASAVIERFTCFEVKPNGNIVDKSASCKVAINGATLRINQSGGVGTTIQWQVRATDAAGNVTQNPKTCQVFVANPGRGH